MDAKLLTPPDRRRTLLIACSALIRRHPISRPFVVNLLRVVIKRKAPCSTFFPAMYAHFGRKEVALVYGKALEAIEEHLFNTRTLNDDCTDTKFCNQICHGCMSYNAQIKCKTCMSVHFCIGCAEYGMCWECDENDNEACGNVQAA